MSTKKGHSSYMTWRIYKDRAVQKIIPSLGKTSNAQKYFAAVMILLTILGTLGIGIYIDGYVLHPPAQFNGICPPPARISNNGQSCTISQIATITQGSTTQVTTIQIPAGTVITQTQTMTTVTVTK